METELLEKAKELEIEVTDDMSEEDLKALIEDGNPSGEGKPAAKEPSLENIKGEYERKLRAEKKRNEEVEQKLVDLESQMKSTSSNKADTDKKKELLDLGYDESLINYFNDEMDKREKKIESKYRNASKREPNVRAAIRADKTGLGAKYEDEFNEILDSVDPDVWGNKEAINRILGMVVYKHIDEIQDLKTSSVGKESATETGPSGLGSKKETALDKDIREFADERGLNISIPEVKKSVIRAINAKKKALS